MAPSIESITSSAQQAWRASASSSFGDPTAPAAAGTTPAAARFPRVPSLVFDIEIEERSEGRAGDEEGPAGGVKELRRWLLPSSTGELKLRNDVELALARYSKQQQQHHQERLQQEAAQPLATASANVETNQRLAAFLTKLGYTVHIRTALGGGEGYECLRNLRHVFLAVLPPGAHATTNRFVVDLSFKEQFRIAKPTPRYQSLLDCLPEAYVAPESSVVPLVNFLCHEMAQAFSATGVVLPPWRQTTSVLSKWVPRKSLDEQVPARQAGATRRSMDQPGGAQAMVQAHWVQQGQRQQPQQRAGEAPGAAQDGVFGAAATTARVEGLTRRVSSGVKPLACEPQRVAIGFA